MTELIALEHHPTGPAWRRVWEALRLASQNVRLRRSELGRDDAVHLYDDLEALAAKDDREGAR